MLCLDKGLKEEQALSAWEHMQKRLADIVDQMKTLKGDTPLFADFSLVLKLGCMQIMTYRLQLASIGAEEDVG